MNDAVSQIRREWDEKARQMFPPCPLTEDEGNTIKPLDKCQHATMTYLDHDNQILSLFNLRSDQIHRYSLINNQWSVTKTGLDPTQQWYNHQLNASTCISGSRVAIFGGNSFSEIDICSKNLSNRLRIPRIHVDFSRMHQHMFDINEEGEIFRFEKGQFQFSELHHTWIYATCEVMNVRFYRLELTNDQQAILKPLEAIPQLPLSNYIDFPTRFFLNCAGSHIFLYNARPFEVRPAKNALLSTELLIGPPVQSHDDEQRADWLVSQVPDELPDGDWRSRFHPKIDSLCMYDDEIYAVDMEWHHCYPDSGYGIFRVCKLVHSSLQDRRWANWEVQRSISAKADHFARHFGYILSCLRKITQCQISNDGFFCLLQKEPGKPMDLCKFEIVPEPLEKLCAQEVMGLYSGSDSQQLKSRGLKKAGVSAKIVAKYFEKKYVQ